MNKLLQKIVSVSLAFLVLLSTFSFAVDKHFCGDFLVAVSFLGDADGCSMDMDETIIQKSCCKDEMQEIKGQDKLKLSSFEEVKFDQKVFLVAFFEAFILDKTSKTESKTYYKEFPPPDIEIDIQVLYQTFLI